MARSKHLKWAMLGSTTAVIGGAFILTTGVSPATHLGRNWTAEGEAIYSAGCNIPAAATTAHMT